jgi:hypothetical protein
MNLLEEKTNMKSTLTKVVAGLASAVLTVVITSRPSFAQNQVTLETDRQREARPHMKKR